METYSVVKPNGDKLLFCPIESAKVLVATAYAQPYKLEHRQHTIYFLELMPKTEQTAKTENHFTEECSRYSTDPEMLPAQG